MDYGYWNIAATDTCHLAGHRLFVAGERLLTISSNHRRNSNTCSSFLRNRLNEMDWE
jgi:hypothetical protein